MGDQRDDVLKAWLSPPTVSVGGAVLASACRTRCCSYWFLVGNKGIYYIGILYRAYIGIMFPCSLLRSRKSVKIIEIAFESQYALVLITRS